MPKRTLADLIVENAADAEEVIHFARAASDNRPPVEVACASFYQTHLHPMHYSLPDGSAIIVDNVGDYSVAD